jgi:hypothetical protein
MRRMALGLVAVLVLATGAWGQAVQPVSATDPVRLNLARQLFEVSGGEKQAKAQIAAMFGVIEKSVAQNLSPDASRLQKPINDFMVQEVIGLVPQIIELSVHAYAETYTEKELRDWLAFATSETGKAIAQKAPRVRLRVMEGSMPLMMKTMREMMRRTAEAVCAEQRCTAAERQVVTSALMKAAPRPAG